MSNEWTDEQREAVVEAYVGAEPTPETSMDIVKELADEYDKTVNGVRMILLKAEVYVKKEPAKSSESSGDKPKRVSRADSIEALEAAIAAAGHEVDEAIVSKLTGKAAVYFTNILGG